MMPPEGIQTIRYDHYKTSRNPVRSRKHRVDTGLAAVHHQRVPNLDSPVDRPAMQPDICNIVVYEDDRWRKLLPLVYSRGVVQLICGSGSLLKQVCRLVTRGTLRAAPGLWCRPALEDVVAAQTGAEVNRPTAGPVLFLNGRGRWHQLPDDPGPGSWVGIDEADEQIVCIHADAELARALSPEILLDSELCAAAVANLPRRTISNCVTLFDGPWEIVLANEQALIDDWTVDGAGQRQLLGTVLPGSHLLNPEGIHIGAGSRIKPCVVIDAEDGPVWIGNDVTILPHSYIQGPALIGDGCLIQPGSVIHAGSTIGPRCKVGGEIETSILQGFSNKQHDGFLGHSYIGSWVNIAADCINSDLKNTYGSVRVPINGEEIDTGEMFVGMVAGDHSKAGINVSFPTGAVIGFASSVFAPRSPKFVPSFAWVDDSSTRRYDPQKGLDLAKTVMARRGVSMSEADEQLYLSVWKNASRWECQTSFVDAAPSLSRQAIRENSQAISAS